MIDYIYDDVDSDDNAMMICDDDGGDGDDDGDDGDDGDGDVMVVMMVVMMMVKLLLIGNTILGVCSALPNIFWKTVGRNSGTFCFTLSGWYC